MPRYPDITGYSSENRTAPGNALRQIVSELLALVRSRIRQNAGILRAPRVLANTASAPVKAFEQIGESPIQGNVTALKPTVVTAFP